MSSIVIKLAALETPYQIYIINSFINLHEPGYFIY
jgi:hypothetical protein